MKRDLKTELCCAKYKDDFRFIHGYLFCEMCGMSNQYFYEVHHIFFRSEKPKHKNLNKIENLILVCRKCHNKLHEHKSLRRDLRKYHNANQLFYVRKGYPKSDN